MRIAIFHNLPSGGAKRTLYESVRRMVSAHHIDVYTLTSGNHEFCDLRPLVGEHFEYDFNPSPLFNSPFGRLNQGLRYRDLNRLHAINREIAVDIEARDYDVLLAHPCQFEIAPSVLRFASSIPTVYYCHEPLRRLYEEPPKRPYQQASGGWKSKLDRFDPLINLYHSSLKRKDLVNTRAADRVLVNSRFIQDSVKNIYQVEAHISYHGVDTEVFEPMDIQQQPFLFSVGSLTPLKGFDFLIESVGKIPQDQRPAFKITSNFQNPAELFHLKQLAEECQVEVNFLSDISEAELVDLYNQAALTLYAPIREPFGLVPLESMACGTPVIGVCEGGLLETIRDQEVGLLVERDPQVFADAILSLLKAPDKLRQYSENGRAYVLREWSWQSAVNSLVDHLEDSINSDNGVKISAGIQRPQPEI